jgi:hypothetical protein
MVDAGVRCVYSAGGSLRVLHGKGDKARTAPLPADASEAIDRWLDCRKRLGLTGRHPLSCTLTGDRLWDSYVRTLPAARGEGPDRRRPSFSQGLPIRPWRHMSRERVSPKMLIHTFDNIHCLTRFRRKQSSHGAKGQVSQTVTAGGRGGLVEAPR